MGVVKPLLKGLQLTLRTFFTRPVTLQYPEQKMPMFPRFRGLPELARDAEGKLICVACELCAAACPAGCIRVEAGEGPEHRRFPRVYEIDLGRCIFCGFCVEACPYGAVLLGRDYEGAASTRKDLVYSIDWSIDRSIDRAIDRLAPGGFGPGSVRPEARDKGAGDKGARGKGARDKGAKDKGEGSI